MSQRCGSSRLLHDLHLVELFTHAFEHRRCLPTVGSSKISIAGFPRTRK